MRKVISATAAAALLAFAGGCATTSVSWQERLGTYPLIRLGDPRPAGEEYVVHLPAGQKVPMKVRLKGSVFQKETEQEVYAVPARDIYLYKDFISFDRKRWTRTKATLDLGWDAGMPSWKNPVPGHLMIEVNEKEQ